MKILKCPFCKSENIGRDATASWNPEAEKWDLDDIETTIYCKSCGDYDISPTYFCIDEEEYIKERSY